MTVERSVRLLAGVMVLASLALAYYVSPYWYLLTAFCMSRSLMSMFFLIRVFVFAVVVAVVVALHRVCIRTLMS